MPVTIPKPVLVKPVEPAAQDRAVTFAELQAALDARDAVWASHLDAMAKALIAAIPKPVPPPPPAPRKPMSVEFLFDNLKNPIGAKIIPEN